MKLLSGNKKYVMPKCHACNKRFRQEIKTSLILSFTWVDNSDKRQRDKYVSVEDFCPKCKDSIKANPRAFLKEITNKRK